MYFLKFEYIQIFIFRFINVASSAVCDDRKNQENAKFCKIIFLKKIKNILKTCVPQPTQPWHKKHHRRRVTHKRCQARRLQGNTALILRGITAICNKMCKHGVGWAEIKPHLGGHGANTQAPAVRPIRTEQRPNQHNKCCPQPFRRRVRSVSSGPGRPDPHTAHRADGLKNF